MHKDILVIDDNPDIRFLICNILKEQNFNVRSAANFDQAVLEINKKTPDLAVVDIKLDKVDKDGIDLLKLIISRNKLTPVIMISGHATVQIAVEAIRLGAYDNETSNNIFISERDCVSNFNLKKFDINNSTEIIRDLIKSE